MSILVNVWSDNKGKDETFGSDPNRPHFVYTGKVEGQDLVAAILQSVYETIIPKDCHETIRVIGSGPKMKGYQTIRLRIAENEYVCSATLQL